MIADGVTPAYQNRIEKILGDASPHYLELLEELAAHANSANPENFDEVYGAMERVIYSVKDYVSQFGCDFAVFFVIDQHGKCGLRTALVDKLANKTPQ